MQKAQAANLDGSVSKSGPGAAGGAKKEVEGAAARELANGAGAGDGSASGASGSEAEGKKGGWQLPSKRKK